MADMEMNLDNLKCRKITSVEGNCTDPDYLPGSRLVFSKLTMNDTVKLLIVFTHVIPMVQTSDK